MVKYIYKEIILFDILSIKYKIHLKRKFKFMYILLKI